MVGVVYGRQIGDPGAVQWNEKLFGRMQEEAVCFQREGLQVIIGGDFNAHFRQGGGGNHQMAVGWPYKH